MEGAEASWGCPDEDGAEFSAPRGGAGRGAVRRSGALQLVLAALRGRGRRLASWLRVLICIDKPRAVFEERSQRSNGGRPGSKST